MMADFALALRGMLPVGCTHPGIRAVWVLSATLFPDTEGDVLERPEETSLCPAGENTSFYSQARESKSRKKWGFQSPGFVYHLEDEVVVERWAWTWKSSVLGVQGFHSAPPITV